MFKSIFNRFLANGKLNKDHSVSHNNKKEKINDQEALKGNILI